MFLYGCAIVSFLCLPLVRYIITRRPIKLTTDSGIPFLPGYPLLGCGFEFLSRRNDFVRECLTLAKDCMCEIQLPTCRAILLSGSRARAAFLNNKGLSLQNGYVLLQPLDSDWRAIKGMPSTDGSAGLSWFHSRLTSVVRWSTLEKRHQRILSDVDDIMNSLGRSGTIEPFEALYSHTVRLIVRVMCPEDIADDPLQARHISSLLATLEADDKNAKITTYILPWIPSVSAGTLSLRKRYYGYKLYRFLQGAIESRANTPNGADDMIQYMTEKGDGPKEIITFLLGSLTAGATNTSRVQVWLLIALHVYPDWKAKVMDEIHTILSEHSVDPDDMDGVPLKVWDVGMPVMTSIIHELLRYLGKGALLRQNVGEPFEIEGRTIPTETYLVYPMFDVHHDPSLHKKPHDFDPTRNLYDGGANVNFVGFGAGRHPCPGRQIATTILKLWTIRFLLKFDYQVTDGRNNVLKALPPYEANSLHVPNVDHGVDIRIKLRSCSELE